MEKGKISSAIHNFHLLSLKEKINVLKKFAGLDKKDLEILKKYQKLPDFIDSENNIGPFKIATNFLVNGKDYFVPMEIEEPSVVAAASRGAKLIREGGGFWGRYLKNQIVGQIQLISVKDFKKAKFQILKNKKRILEMANRENPILLKLGGGAKNLKLKRVKNFLVFYLILDPKDAMGANTLNKMLEKITPFLAKITKAKVNLKIVSNFCPGRIVHVWGKVPIEKLKFKKIPGKEVAERMLMAQELARFDIYRAVTHNKGIMNGIDAVALATGNDFRAIESAVHSYAAKNGKYKPLTTWKMEGEFLKGEIKLPMPIATVGGLTSMPKAKLALKILRVKNAQELGIVAASVGLANNLSAIFALVTEGIHKGFSKIYEEILKKMVKYKSC
jgi:hydroxymethylglutaryl-CoA reductase